MLRDRRKEYLAAAILVGPFVLIYGALFVWPTIQMVLMSFTDAPLIGPGDWVGLKNYVRIISHKLFGADLWNTSYFVLLTVIPNTLGAALADPHDFLFHAHRGGGHHLVDAGF